MVVDLVARDVVVAEWRELATQYGARFTVIECVCPDAEVHRARVDGRDRSIPGWYELDWAQVERGRDRYAPLTGPKLTLDAGRGFDDNLALALELVAA